MLAAETWTNYVDNYAWTYVPLVGVSVAVFLVFWMLGTGADRVIRRLGLSRRIDPDVIGLLAGTAKTAMLILGSLTALGTLGINVTAMVAGLGLTGLALGMAFKEILSNALAGVQILMYKPFKRNDVIAALTFQGTVMEVDLRYTSIESSGVRVFIPNTLLLTNAVSLISVGKGNGNGENPNTKSQIPNESQ
jgi:small conductance mechanosensitive channel